MSEKDFQDENNHTEENLNEANSAEEISTEEQLQKQLDEANDKYARLFAEFDNYKKRTSREKVDLIQSAGKEVIAKLLPVLDDFDRALASMENSPSVESVKEGIDLVNNKFRKTLEQQGLKEMDVLGQPFDAEYQEAITTTPAPSEDLKNKVVDVLEKGYFLNDKVVRFAKVIIGQ
ncbi:nucleotide exchange factor GrpE [Sphingobacterium hungaricum]|uniref:Protein GrpE n=1 Tax=Sphingobacterium hungaricum TaxID=2082723 RepID=A0A928YNV4_9SPHI|nr:nucleotide exchange factor GrpE [Sphingobacterium hungaricum]MBE8712259.1 nucleotide exchange factor GrpE [Sphingobacterium hungaricum]